MTSAYSIRLATLLIAQTPTQVADLPTSSAEKVSVLGDIQAVTLTAVSGRSVWSRRNRGC
jgi:hypothetical protein